MDNLVNNEKYNFGQIESLNVDFKKYLEDEFDLVFIVLVKELEKSQEGCKSSLGLSPEFTIEKQNTPIFERITGVDSIVEISETIRGLYAKLINDTDGYIQRVEGQLPENDIEAFDIISRLLKNRNKKLTSALKKFKIQDDWNVSRIKSEYTQLLSKLLKDIIEGMIRPIQAGISRNSAYSGLLTQFNHFLKTLGVSTIEFEPGHKIIDSDYDLIEPLESDDLIPDHKALSHTVKSSESLVYVFSEHEIILESKVYIWKVINE